MITLEEYTKKEIEEAKKAVKMYDCFHADNPDLMKESMGYRNGIEWALRHLSFFREQIDLERRMDNAK